MYLKRVILSLSMVALLGSGLKADIMVYGPGGPAPVLKELAKQFEEQTKQKVQIIAGPTPSWIEKAKKDADIIFAGNSSMMDTFIKTLPNQFNAQNIQVLNIRQAGIVVRPNNPKKIKKFDDILKNDIKVMIVDGAGQVGLYEDIALRKGKQENLVALRKNIVFYAFDDILKNDIKVMIVDGAGQVGLYEDIALRKGKQENLVALRKNIVFYAPNSKAAVERWNQDKDIDALIIWSHWANTLGDESAAFIPLKADEVIYRAAEIAISNTSKQKDKAEQFITFIQSKDAQQVWKKWGWQTK